MTCVVVAACPSSLLSVQVGPGLSLLAGGVKGSAWFSRKAFGPILEVPERSMVEVWGELYVGQRHRAVAGLPHGGAAGAVGADGLEGWSS